MSCLREQNELGHLHKKNYMVHNYKLLSTYPENALEKNPDKSVQKVTIKKSKK